MQGAVAMVVLSLAAINNILIRSIAVQLIAAAAAERPCSSSNVPAMFVFGDSLSDTGNAAIMGNAGAFRSTMLPYGETYPGRPTGRFSDGRLMIDHLATYLGMPYSNPFQNTTASFTAGVNYAVAGATALNTSFLNSLQIFPTDQLYIEEQLTWHLTLKAEVELGAGEQTDKPSLASFSDGLYVIGIGGNDYFTAFNSTHSFSYINATFVHIVIQKIRQVAETLYINGARNFLIFGVQHLGCLPRLLEEHLTATRDSDGCVQDYNSVAYNHGVLLLSEVESLRRTYPDATFLFADYYGAHTYVLRNRETYGLTNALDACCGAGTPYPYNFNSADFCSNLAAFLCSDPNTHINWDGLHYSDNFNLQVFNQIFKTGSYLKPSNGLHSCSNVDISNGNGLKAAATTGIM